MRQNGESFDEVLERIRKEQESPEGIERRKAEELEADREFQKDFAKRKRSQVDGLGLAPKDLAILRSGLVNETEAVAATREPVVLLVLSGGPGCGKTVAAASWLYRWVDDDGNWPRRNRWDIPYFHGGTAMLVTAAKLSRWSKYDDDEMNKILKCTRLVVDDLGAEYVDEKGSYLSLLDEVVNERYSHQRPTLMTTNLDAAQFKARYGERITDRIRESGRFVSVGAASMRRKAPTAA